MLRLLWAKCGPYGIALFYFALGFVFVFPSVNIWLFLKEVTGLDPGMLVMEMQMVDVPWLFKPVYAWISDRFPLLGYRRKSYVIMFSLYCGIMWLVMPLTTKHLWMFYLVWAFENLFLCIADVVVDALVIERVKASENDPSLKGKLQSACSTMRSLGKCVGALAGTVVLVEGVGRHEIFIITAMAPLIVAVASFYITENRAKSDLDVMMQSNDDSWEKANTTGENLNNWRFYMKTMFSGFINTDMWKFCMVATCYIVAPKPDAGYFYYYDDVLKMPDFALQMTSFAHEIGLFAGAVYFGLYLRYKPAKPLMINSTLVVVCLLMLQPVVVFLLPLPLWGQILYAYIHEFVMAIADIFLFMPLAIMAAKLCTTGLEGTSYALVLSIQNLGGFIDNALAAQIMNALSIKEGNMDHLWYMSFFCAFWFLAPMTLFPILPTEAELTPVKTQTENKEM